jgi:N-acetylglucosaminyldiphosphoundecaprenol N-acetyl-beta-D-mannosaminyltransferase
MSSAQRHASSQAAPSAGLRVAGVLKERLPGVPPEAGPVGETAPDAARSPGWTTHWAALYERIHWCATEADKEQLSADLSHPARSQRRVVAFLNAHAMNIAAERSEFAQHLLAADVLLRDGIGLAIQARLAGRDAGLNMNGTDYIPELLRRFDGRPIALLGTTPEAAEASGARVRRELATSSTVHTMHGFLPAGDYVDAMLVHRPALIVLGMGMPKQEAVAFALRERLTHPCVIVCGGAILDFLSGRVVRAPQWMRSSGLEWVHRLVHEPRRLFARYVVGNPRFLARALWLRWLG